MVKRDRVSIQISVQGGELLEFIPFYLPSIAALLLTISITTATTATISTVSISFSRARTRAAIIKRKKGIELESIK